MDSERTGTLLKRLRAERLPVLSVMVNIDGQLDRTQNHMVDKVLGMYARESLNWLSWGGKPHPNAVCHWSWLLNCVQGESKLSVSIHFSLCPATIHNLTSYVMSLLPCLANNDGLCLQTISQSKLILSGILWQWWQKWLLLCYFSQLQYFKAWRHPHDPGRVLCGRQQELLRLNNSGFFP